MGEEHYLSRAQIAERAGVTRRQVTRYQRAGLLPGSFLGHNTETGAPVRRRRLCRLWPSRTVQRVRKLKFENLNRKFGLEG